MKCTYCSIYQGQGFKVILLTNWYRFEDMLEALNFVLFFSCTTHNCLREKEAVLCLKTFDNKNLRIKKGDDDVSSVASAPDVPLCLKIRHLFPRRSFVVLVTLFDADYVWVAHFH